MIVGAMDEIVLCPKLGLLPLAAGLLQNDVARLPVEELMAVGDDGAGLDDLVHETEMVHYSGGVGGHLDPGADLAQDGGLLQHGDLEVCAEARDCAGEAPQAGAYYDDPERNLLGVLVGTGESFDDILVLRGPVQTSICMLPILSDDDLSRDFDKYAESNFGAVMLLYYTLSSLEGYI